MPFFRGRSRRRATRRRFKRRRKFPRRTLFRKRQMAQGTDIKVFRFKQAEILSTEPASTQLYDVAIATGVSQPGGPAQFDTIKALYREYKVLSFSRRFMPYNIGAESSTVGGFFRGNCATWALIDGEGTRPITIGDKINNASVRVISPRRPHMRYLSRPRGEPNWAETNGTGTSNADDWTGEIVIMNDNATNSTALWYAVTTWKVAFRGRNDG